LSRRLDQKTVWLACAFHAHRHASFSDLDFRLLTLFGSLALTPMTPANFLVQKETRERQRRFKSESQSIPSSCYEKDRRWQSCWAGIWRQPN
jgi:hypothetical protein